MFGLPEAFPPRQSPRQKAAAVPRSSGHPRSEGFSDGSLLEGLRFLNPLVRTFDAAWLHTRQQTGW
jgi:hypothetical protein